MFLPNLIDAVKMPIEGFNMAKKSENVEKQIGTGKVSSSASVGDPNALLGQYPSFRYYAMHPEERERDAAEFRRLVAKGVRRRRKRQ